MHRNIIKQVSDPDERAVPFENWITADADRIPSRMVTVDEEEPHGRQRPGFSHQNVINRSNARVASRRIAVNMIPAISMHVGHGSARPGQDEESEDEETLPFGLSEEEFSTLRKQWKEEQRAQLDEERARIQEDAYTDGYEAAAAEAEEEIRELHTMLGDGWKQIESRWAAHMEEIEPQLGRLALDIAERILDAPLPEDVHENVAAAIHDAIDEVAGQTRTDVTLHPADYMRLKETGLLQQLNTTYESLHWHSDPELEKRGDWVVETPKAAIRHIQAELLADVEQALELP